jgi:hypothetical protein
MKTFIRSNVFLTAAEKAALKKIARRRRVSTAMVIREFLDKGLDLPVSTTPYSHVAGSRG